MGGKLDGYLQLAADVLSAVMIGWMAGMGINAIPIFG